MFDGSWNSHGLTASRGIVSAIAESTSQVLDVAYKSRVCSQCVGVEYLDWYIRHESNCFTNHDGSAQVSILCKKFSLLLQNIRAKSFHTGAGKICTFFIKKKKILVNVKQHALTGSLLSSFK